MFTGWFAFYGCSSSFQITFENNLSARILLFAIRYISFRSGIRFLFIEKTEPKVDYDTDGLFCYFKKSPFICFLCVVLQQKKIEKFALQVSSF